MSSITLRAHSSSATPVNGWPPITAVVGFALLAGALQWWYLDRLTVRGGADRDDVAASLGARVDENGVLTDADDADDAAPAEEAVPVPA